MSDAKALDLGSVAQWASALASITTGAIAIWGPQIRQFLVPSKLRLELLDPTGQDSGGTGDKPIVHRWYHLRVNNDALASPVTEVRIFLLKVERCRSVGPDGREAWDCWEEILPMNYRSEKSLGLGNTRKVGHFADGDLFCLKPTELVLSTAQHPNHGMPRSFKGPVKLRVMLQARGMEGRSPALTVIIEWNGIWENEKDRRDLMPNHCKAYLYRPTSG